MLLLQVAIPNDLYKSFPFSYQHPSLWRHQYWIWCGLDLGASKELEVGCFEGKDDLKQSLVCLLWTELAPEVCSSLRTTICFVFSISSTSVQKLLPRIKSGLLCSNTLAIQPEKSKGCSLEICKQNVSNLLTLKECMLNSFLS